MGRKKKKKNNTNNKKVMNKEEMANNVVNAKTSEQEEVKEEKQKEAKAENEVQENAEKPEEKSTEEACDTKDQLQLELSAIKDKYVRLSAEFDNYRKRTLKEKMDLTKTANQDLLVDILPVMDNFERALKAMEEAQSADAVKEGVLLIYNRFKEFLQQKGVKEIESKELEFDTDVHEAITKIPAPSQELKGKVVDIIEKGYFLNDKVIRFAKVVIGE